MEDSKGIKDIDILPDSGNTNKKLPLGGQGGFFSSYFLVFSPKICTFATHKTKRIKIKKNKNEEKSRDNLYSWRMESH